MKEKTATKMNEKSRKTRLLVFLAAGMVGLAGLYLVGKTYLGGRNVMVVNYLRNP